MKLERVFIENYRSIKSIIINIKYNCIILAGVNESGKTNILSALSLLSEDEEPTKNDIREALPDEEPVKDSFVRFVFNLEAEQHYYMREGLQEKIIVKDAETHIATDRNENKFTILDICKDQKEGLYRVDIIDQIKFPSLYAIPKNKYILNTNFNKPSPKCPKDYYIDLGDDEILLDEVDLINSDDFPEIPDEYLVKADATDLTKAIGRQIRRVVEAYLPSCVLWKYTENNLLPGKINTEMFRKDASHCIPLRNMFYLAGITDIDTSISDAQDKANGMRNLLNRVASVTTKHIREVWKEHSEISIFLAENGTAIEAGVEDKFNIFDFSRRSDGFKRFITFLLLISARERTENLQNNIIIIDEPDIALHPSGSKDLREELIKISNTNIVIFSTHSVFMIDKSNIGRHLIVSKKNEITTADTAGVANMFDEEVIYNAMGYSLFESLKQENLIFEGWRDKLIFLTAIKTTSKKHKTALAPLKKLGVCNAQGVKDIPRVASTLELASRNCLIISDNDKVAIQRKKEYHGHGSWLTYNDLDETCQAITSEDFIKVSKFKDPLKTIQGTYGIAAINEVQLKESASRIAFISAWLKKEGLKPEEIKTSLNTFKSELFDSLKPIHIEDDFYKMIKKIPKLLSDQ